MGGIANDPGMAAEYQFVEAEVLKPNTPVEIARLAAGEHQEHQQAVENMSVSDVFAMFVKSAREKMEGKLKTPFLTDNEVAMIAWQCGLQKFKDKHGNTLSEQKAVCNTPLSSSDSALSFLSQKTILVQHWRPFAFWASCSCDDDQVVNRVKLANLGCIADREHIRPATFKDIGNLNVADMKAFNQWLLELDRPTFKDVQTKLNELRHRRAATWHIMAHDNPSIDPNCSMLPCVSAWVWGCPGVAGLQSFRFCFLVAF
jgi:hypothetical protein